MKVRERDREGKRGRERDREGKVKSVNVEKEEEGGFHRHTWVAQVTRPHA